MGHIFPSLLMMAHAWLVLVKERILGHRREAAVMFMALTEFMGHEQTCGSRVDSGNCCRLKFLGRR